MELTHRQLWIFLVEQEKAELLATVGLVGAGAGIQREGERRVEVGAGLIEPVGLVRDDAEQRREERTTSGMPASEAASSASVSNRRAGPRSCTRS
jgi:hypothetical protein